MTNDEHLSSNQLASERTDWALKRTLMALERSFMALIRTSVALISFGFTIYKFLEAFKDEGNLGIRNNSPRNVGLFLILLGVGVLVFGLFQHMKLKNLLLDGEKRTIAVSLSVVAAVGVLLVGLFTLLNIFLGFGGF